MRDAKVFNHPTANLGFSQSQEADQEKQKQMTFIAERNHAIST